MLLQADAAAARHTADSILERCRRLAQRAQRIDDSCDEAAASEAAEPLSKTGKRNRRTRLAEKECKEAHVGVEHYAAAQCSKVQLPAPEVLPGLEDGRLKAGRSLCGAGAEHMPCPGLLPCPASPAHVAAPRRGSKKHLALVKELNGLSGHRRPKVRAVVVAIVESWREDWMAPRIGESDELYMLRFCELLANIRTATAPLLGYRGEL